MKFLALVVLLGSVACGGRVDCPEATPPPIADAAAPDADAGSDAGTEAGLDCDALCRSNDPACEWECLFNHACCAYQHD